MPTPEIVTHAIALGHEPRGETYTAYRLLSIERGTVTGLIRRSKKPNAQLNIDLFDEGEFRIDLKPGSFSGFIKDAQIERKRTQLARNYDAFKAAARFANLIVSNPAYDENIIGIFELLNKGLNAWENNSNPHATYFKCLYLYCRQEGYPVKEEWAQRLPKKEKPFVAQVLNRPLEEQVEEAELLKRTIDSLEFYTRHRTHIRLET
ncbi:MAG: hypothetical protein ACJ07L_13905 [Opitutales bacterium]